jgi:hypothetical protein
VAECSQARNLSEFIEAASSIMPEKHRLVIFAMLTNIIVDAGNTVADPYQRLHTIDNDCLGPLISSLK